MLDLEIVPEKSIATEKWQIILGMSINQVIQILKNNCDSVRSLQLIYNDKEPLNSDYIIKLHCDGIILYFDSLNQKLKLIEINDLKKLKLRYYGNYFNNLPTIQPTFDQITETFGITSPGIYDDNSGVIMLHFPGLFFTFNIDFRVEPKSISHHSVQSLDFPTGRKPLVSKISIYSGSSPSTAQAPEIPSLCLSKEIVYCSKVTIIRDYNLATRQGFTKGINLNLFTQGLGYQLDREHFDAQIMFNDTCQDVMTAIGSPSSVYYKSEEINKNGAIQSDPSKANDYFYNYKLFGLDLLFSAGQNQIIKFIFHSNFPCHYNFNNYFMCNFEIPILVNQETNQTFVVTQATTLEKLQDNLNIKTQPAILHRSSSTNSVNPFGPAFFYVYEDIIFEVMTNGYIASVTIACNR